MQPTQKLYFTDSQILNFSATVVEVRPSANGDQVVLDRTAFYPTGGGQPNDTGKLGDVEVADVFEDESGTVIHLVKEAHRISPGQKVEGHIDRARRFDHMQQHSGQHILSQAFIKTCGAETRSFHLGSQTSTIDIDLQSATEEQIRAAEELANSIIFEDRPLHIHLLSDEQAAQVTLKKENALKEQVRIIEVEDFDRSPCCGTHTTGTGQIGLIAIKSYERAKKMTRVEFVCGHRALADYRRANSAAVTIARMVSADRDSAPDLIARALQENKSLRKRLRDLLELALTAEASQMLSGANASDNFKIVRAVFDGRDLEELRILASKIVEQEPAVALLGSNDSGAGRLVFARSAMLPQNMGQLMSEACQLLNGRGGGKPELAQGGGPAAQMLDEAIKLAVERVREAIRS